MKYGIIKNLDLRKEINNCVTNKWLRLILLVFCKYVLRKKSLYSVVCIYFGYAFSFFITKPTIGYAIVKHTLGSENLFAKFALALVDFLSGTVNNTMFCIVTIVVVMLIIQYTIVEYFKSKSISSEDVKEIKNSQQEQAIFSPFTPAKASLASDNSYNPIPTIHSTRAKLVDELKQALLSNKHIHINGGIKEGKLILSFLVAKSLDGFRLIYIPFANENNINICKLLDSYSKDEKLVFILDAVKMSSEEYYKAFYDCIIASQSENRTFIVNSYEKMSDILFENDNVIFEKTIPLLTKEEVEEMIPVDKRELYSSLIYVLFNGQPLLTNLLCTSLTQKQWSLTSEELEDLLIFPNKMGLEGKVRKLVRKFITHDNGEAYHLLNRLLYYGLDFTEMECQDLASIDPVIHNPLLLLNDLCSFCVKKENEIYHISDLLQKTLTIDLIDKDKENCAKYFVQKILQKKEITQFEVLRALSYLISAKCYDDAALLYINVISSICNTGKQLDEKYSILTAVWRDLPLPEKMSFESKLGVRVCQLSILYTSLDADLSYIESDIDRLLSSNQTKSILVSASMQTLVAYYTLKGNVHKVVDYYRKIDPAFVLEDLSSIGTKDLIFANLKGINNEKDLKDWFDLYDSNGRPEYELLSNGAIAVIKRLCASSADVEKTLIYICDKSVSYDVSCFLVAACANLIDIYSSQASSDKATVVFEKYSYLLETDFGAILLNYSMGLYYYNTGDEKNAKAYIEASCSNPNIGCASMVAFSAACKLSQIYSNEGHAHEALLTIIRIVENSNFDRCYIDYEKACIYGTLAYAYWEDGDSVSAVRNLLKVEEYLWKSHDQIDDTYKSLAMRFDVLALYIYVEHQKKEHNPDFALPDYGLFTKEAPGLVSDYKPLRNFTVLYLIYHFAEFILNDDEVSIEIIEHIIQLHSTDGAGYGQIMAILLEAYPMLLKHGRKDLIEYIILKGLADSVIANEEKSIDYEQLILLGFLRHIVAYRVICHAKNEEFDDEWVYSIIDKAVAYIEKPVRTMQLLGSMQADEPNFYEIEDQEAKVIAMTWCLDKIDVKGCLIPLHIVCVFLDATGRAPSSKRQLELFAKSYARLILRYFANDFRLRENNSDEYFARIQSYEIEYVHDIMRGLEYNMKFYPTKNDTISKILE